MMKFYLVFLAIFISCLNIHAQKKVSPQQKVEMIYNDAKIKAQSGESDVAAELLQQILKIDPNYYLAHFGLADIYHDAKKPELEIAELNSGLKLSGDKFPKGFKYLAQALYAREDYAEALKNMERYSLLNHSLTAEETRILESCRFSATAFQTSVSFHPQNAGEGINTVEDEYWPCLNAEANELVFTRLMKYDVNGKKLQLPQEDLYLSKKDSGVWRKAVALGAPVNTPDNEGAQCISADGKLLFFTGCGRPDGQGSCDIYMSVRKNDKWSDPVNLGPPVNTGSWESQPSVSADGRYLYFTSNRSGGKGKMDIWRAEKIGTTPKGFPEYGNVSNLESINTPGNELSPFIHADGKTLYFASDYWPGLGGKDLFFVRIENNKTSKPQNLGFPINSSADEEGMVVEVNGEQAWFTSNHNSIGGCDIFSFRLPEKARPQPVSYVKGKIIDNRTKKTLFSDIKLYDLTSNKVIQHIYPFENEGDFLLCLPIGMNYGLSIEKEGYLFCSRNFDLEQSYSSTNPKNLLIGLDPIEPGMVTVLNNIFFNTDSFNLKPQSKPQLDEIVTFMNKNAGLIIEISGHTDNKGSDAYNKELSEKRAISVVTYLVDKGVSQSRLKSKGYGFSKPVADNSTEEGRAVNRRTEFKILEINKKQK
jgi:outer membrane protein OmpA-like peptidoglycan-associated protein